MRGCFTIEGKLVKGKKLEEADAAVEAVLEKIKLDKVVDTELMKVKNKTESLIAFEDMSVMNRAASLANYELLGNANLMNEEMERFLDVSAEDVYTWSNKIFTRENSNTLFYRSKN